MEELPNEQGTVEKGPHYGRTTGPVGFIEAIKDFYRRYFDFKGRSSVSAYWWIQLYVGVVALLGTPGFLIPEDATGWEMLIGLVAMLLLLASVIPFVMLSIRRMHDTGKSGWFTLIMLFPFGGNLIFWVLATLSPKPDNKWGPAPGG